METTQLNKPEQMLAITYHTVRLWSVNATSVTAAYIAPPDTVTMYSL